VLHLDPLGPRTPRLPHRRLGALSQLAASTALHLTLVVIAALIKTTVAHPASNSAEPDRPPTNKFSMSCFSRVSERAPHSLPVQGSLWRAFQHRPSLDQATSGG
jgi:hypothetical protein